MDLFSFLFEVYYFLDYFPRLLEFWVTERLLYNVAEDICQGSPGGPWFSWGHSSLVVYLFDSQSPFSSRLNVMSVKPQPQWSPLVFLSYWLLFFL